MDGRSLTTRPELTLAPVSCEAPEVGVWLTALARCRARTRREIAGLRSTELDLRGPASPNTIGTLLYHIAVIELDWLYAEILERAIPEEARLWCPHEVRDSEGTLTPVVGDSLERHEERLQLVRDALVGALSTMSLVEFRRIRCLEDYDVTPEGAVFHLLQHEAEHRGQIAILRHGFIGDTTQT